MKLYLFKFKKSDPCIRSLFHIILCVWICNNCPKLHKNWNPIYCWTPWTYTLALPRNTKHMHGFRWPSLLSQMAFANPVKPQRCITGSLELVNSINKDMCGARLLSMTVSAYLVIEPVSVTYWRHGTAVCVLIEGITFLWLITHSSLLPTQPPPAHSPLVMCHLWHYSSCENICSKSRSVQ